MYITTSRKPSDSTRRLAKIISNFIGPYENRGKKSIEEIVTRADGLGENRVMIISESGGNPNSISFISISKEWEWMSPELRISAKTDTIPSPRRLEKPVKYSGDKKYSELFDFPEPDTDDTIEVWMDDKKISFSYKKFKFIINIKELKHLKKD